MADAGFKLEEGVTYKVIEAPKFVKYIVIPHEGAKEVVQKLSAGLLNRIERADVVIPDGVEVRIIQNTDDLRCLILPASPKTLTAAELKAISGGDYLTHVNYVWTMNFAAVFNVEAAVHGTTVVTFAEVGLVVVLI